jgi:ribosomal protein S18 acetylase RimI-like enzyme
VFDAAPPILCRGILVAVANAHRRKGHGRRLKQAMIDAARAAGAVAISSTVDRRNHGMIALNRSLGALVERIPDDPDNVRCIVALR